MEQSNILKIYEFFPRFSVSVGGFRLPGSFLAFAATKAASSESPVSSPLSFPVRP